VGADKTHLRRLRFVPSFRASIASAGWRLRRSGFSPQHENQWHFAAWRLVFGSRCWRSGLLLRRISTGNRRLLTWFKLLVLVGSSVLSLRRLVTFHYRLAQTLLCWLGVARHRRWRERLRPSVSSFITAPARLLSWFRRRFAVLVGSTLRARGCVPSDSAGGLPCRAGWVGFFAFSRCSCYRFAGPLLDAAAGVPMLYPVYRLRWRRCSRPSRTPRCALSLYSTAGFRCASPPCSLVWRSKRCSAAGALPFRCSSSRRHRAFALHYRVHSSMLSAFSFHLCTARRRFSAILVHVHGCLASVALASG